jgi:hypothetical protein
MLLQRLLLTQLETPLLLMVEMIIMVILYQQPIQLLFSFTLGCVSLRSFHYFSSLITIRLHQSVKLNHSFLKVKDAFSFVFLLVLTFCFSSLALSLSFSSSLTVAHQSYSRKEVDNSGCHQSGLQQSIVGMILYGAVLLTMIGLQIILLLLVICYYFILDRADVEKDTPGLNMGWSPFSDAPNSLYVFIIAWAVSFAFVAFFHRPQSLYSVFLRRCELREANTVAVFMPDSRGVETLVKDGRVAGEGFFAKFAEYFDKGLSFMFSEPEHKEPGTVTYCHIATDDQGVRYFEYQMRRYNFHPEEDTFLPAEFSISGELDMNFYFFL